MTMRSGIKTARAYGRRFSNKAMREHFGWSGKFSKEVHIQANAGNSWANVVLLVMFAGKTLISAKALRFGR